MNPGAAPPANHKAHFWLSILFFLWTGTLGAFYFHYHPLDPKYFQYVVIPFQSISFSWDAFQQTWANQLGSLLLLAFLLVLSAGLGKKIFDFLSLRFSPKQEMVLATCAGLFVISQIVLGAGLCGLYFSLLFYGICFGLLLYIAGPYPRPFLWLGEWWRAFKTEPKPALSWFELGLKAVFLLTLIIGLGATFAPEFGWDPMIYHLRVPSHYAQGHGIFNIPQIAHSYFPFNMEMLYTLGFLLKGETLSKLINFSMGLLTVWLLYLFCLQLDPAPATTGSPGPSRRAGWFCLALVYTTPVFVILTTQAYVDVEVCLFLFLCLWMLLKIGEAKDSRRFDGLICLMSLFGAALLGLKYSGIVYIFLLGVILGWLLWSKTGKPGHAARAVLWFWLFTFILFLPWLIKDFVLTGNPVYPLFAKWFKETGFNPYFSNALAEKVIPYAAPMKLMDRVAYILHFAKDLLIKGQEVGTVSVLYLVFLPVLFFYWKQRPGILNWALVFLGFGIIAGNSSVLDIRYFMPLMVVLSVTFSWAVERFLSGEHFITKSIKIMILILLLGQTLEFTQTVTQNYNPWAVSTGFQKPSDFIGRQTIPRFFYYQMGEYVNSHLPGNSRFVMLGDIMTYYYERLGVFDYQWITPSVWTRVLQGSRTEEEMYRRLRRLGITHVVYNQPKAYSMQFSKIGWEWEEQDQAAYCNLWARRMSKVASFGPMYLYALNPPDHLNDPREPLTVLPAMEEQWLIRADQLLRSNKSKEGVEQAMGVYKEILKMAPNLASAHAGLGIAYLNLGKIAKAGGELDYAYKTGFASVPLYQGLAYIEGERKDFHKALDYQLEAAQLDPFDAQIVKNLAGVYYQLGDLRQAYQYFQRALSMNPADQEIPRYLQKIASQMR